jgi:tetratricopeptide (TPR) repeat protein
MQAKQLLPYLFLLCFFLPFTIISLQTTKKTKLQNILERLEKEDEIESAITILELVISYQPQTTYFLQLASLLKKKKRYQAAIDHLENARAQDPKNNEILVALIEVYRAERNYQMMEIVLEQIEPKTKLETIKKKYEIAALYNGKKQHEKAVVIYEELLSVMPKNKTVLLHYAYTLRCLERIAEARYYFQKVIDLESNNQVALFSKSLAELTDGNYQDGFKGYELRRGYLKTVSENIYTKKPLWDGKRSLAGKKILVYAEQGLGDTIQFIRFLECLKREGAYVIFAVQSRLFTFIQNAYPYIDQLITLKDPAPEHDLYAPLMTLPTLFNISVGTIPSNNTPYLFPDAQLLTQWKTILEKDQNVKIGICFQASNLNLNLFSGPMTSNRSLDISVILDTLSDIPNVSFYSLQKGNGQEMAESHDNLVVFDETFDTDNGAFMDSAAIIPHLDLVISVDTSVAHLAGALGAKTFILLPKPADWRWMYNRSDCPWYKDVTLFRQQKSGDWSTTLEKLKEAVQALVFTNSQFLYKQ